MSIASLPFFDLGDRSRRHGYLAEDAWSASAGRLASLEVPVCWFVKSFHWKFQAASIVPEYWLWLALDFLVFARVVSFWQWPPSVWPVGLPVESPVALVLLACSSSCTVILIVFTKDYLQSKSSQNLWASKASERLN